MATIFIKRGNSNIDMHTERTPHENEDRDWGDVAKAKETLKIASKPQKLGKRRGTDSPSHPSEARNPVDTLFSKFYPFET